MDRRDGRELATAGTAAVIVPSDGPVPADVVVVGEAPGREEEAQRRPFVGPSGRLLRDVVAAKLPGLRVRYTNAVPFWPRRTPTDEEIDQWRPQLFEELARHPHAVIWCVGDVARTAVLGRRRARLADDRLKIWSVVVGTEPHDVVVGWHPAFVLRQPYRRRELEADAEFVAALARGRLGEPQQYSLDVPPARGPLPEVVFDVELNDADEVRCVGLFVPGRGVMITDLPRALEYLERAGAIVAHNAPFDISYVVRRLESRPRVHDTLVLAHLDDPDRAKGLKALGVQLLGLRPWGDLDLTKGKRDAVPDEVLYKYLAADVWATWGLYQRLEEVRRWRVYTHLVQPLHQALSYGELMHPIPVDTDFLRRAAAAYEAGAAAAEERWRHVAGDADPDSPEQVARVLYEHYGLQPKEWTPGGAPSTSAEAIAPYAGHPAVDALLAYRDWVWHLRTCRRLLGDTKDGWLTPEWKVWGTATGRWSSVPNMQNLPRPRPGRPDLRAAVAAPQGYTLVIADYSQIELRVAAAIAGDAAMIDVFRRGGDVHQMMADRIAEVGGGANLDPKELRTRAKILNFGLLYGLDPDGLIRYARTLYGIELSPDTARTYHALFWNTWSGLQRLYRAAGESILENGYVRSPTGRRRWFPGFDPSGNPSVSREILRTAVNTVVQGFAADLTSAALLILHSSTSRAKPILNVHDSVVWLVYEPEAESMARAVVEVMERVVPAWVRIVFGFEFPLPLKVDVRISHRWGTLEEED